MDAFTSAKLKCSYIGASSCIFHPIPSISPTVQLRQYFQLHITTLRGVELHVQPNKILLLQASERSGTGSCICTHQPKNFEQVMYFTTRDQSSECAKRPKPINQSNIHQNYLFHLFPPFVRYIYLPSRNIASIHCENGQSSPLFTQEMDELLHQS